MLNAFPKIQNFFLNQPDSFQECIIIFPGGIFQSPVLPVGTGKKRTLDIAPHGDDHIHFRDVGQELAVLGLLHVDAVNLLHQPYRILVDLRFCFCAGRVAFKHIGSCSVPVYDRWRIPSSHLPQDIQGVLCRSNILRACFLPHFSLTAFPVMACRAGSS